MFKLPLSGRVVYSRYIASEDGKAIEGSPFATCLRARALDAINECDASFLIISIDSKCGLQTVFRRSD